jgi:hypothetical protein
VSNDHYVSQFYFSNFSPDPLDEEPVRPKRGRIRLINLLRRKFVPNASIKGQCKKAGFHDYAPGLEFALGLLEGLASSAIRDLIKENMPPEPWSPGHQALADFTVIQRSRTLGAAENAEKMAARMFKVAYEEEAECRGVDPWQYGIRSRYPVAIPLSVAAQRAPIAMQLGLHVFVNETPEEIITNDNPVIAHNQFCEGINYRGVLGWNCAGIQIFLPVSPRHLLLLYDAQVYALDTKHGCRTSRIVDVAEIRTINAFQIVTARENIYFRDAAMAAPLLAQIERLASRRNKRNITVQSLPVADCDGTSELIHQFERMVPLKLSLRSIGIKRSVRRISLDRRASMARSRGPSARLGPGAGAPLRYAARRAFSD